MVYGDNKIAIVAEEIDLIAGLNLKVLEAVCNHRLANQIEIKARRPVALKNSLNGYDLYIIHYSDVELEDLKHLRENNRRSSIMILSNGLEGY
jgi:hypothetical protein